MKNLILLPFLALLLWNNQIHAQWVQANTGLTLNEVNSFAVIGTTIFAATGNISGNGVGVFKSTDNGNNWSPVNNGLLHLNTKKIIAVGDTLFVAIAPPNITDGGIYKSTDMGATWVEVNNGLPRKLAYSIVHYQGTLYIAISAPASVREVYLSTDYGNTWTITPSAVLNNNTIKSIVGSGGNIIACADGGTKGVYLSTDNGATWSTTSITQETDALAVIGSTVFAATGIGVKKSTDNGVTWTSTTNTAGIIDNATALAVIGNCLLVATPGGRVFSSDDSGTTWNDVSTGASFSLSAETLGMDATYVYAGINFTSTGIWKRPIAEFGCSATGVEDLQYNSLVMLYPNPAQTLVTISNLPNGSTVKIFDIAGKTLYNSTMNNNEITVNTADFANGVYLVQVSNNGSVVNKKLVINK